MKVAATRAYMDGDVTAFVLARFARRLGRFIWDGLEGVGYMSGVAPFLVPPRDTRPPIPQGHPERLVPDEPPTTEERLLWDQLRPPA